MVDENAADKQGQELAGTTSDPSEVAGSQAHDLERRDQSNAASRKKCRGIGQLRRAQCQALGGQHKYRLADTSAAASERQHGEPQLCGDRTYSRHTLWLKRPSDKAPLLPLHDIADRVLKPEPECSDMASSQ